MVDFIEKEENDQSSSFFRYLGMVARRLCVGIPKMSNLYVPHFVSGP